MNPINSDEFNAVVSFNEDCFYFLRMINHGLLIPDYSFGDIIIPVDAAIDNIGLSLRQVLTKNKDEESEGSYIFDHKLNKENYKENIVKLMRLCGYK
ncbi:contact-dependent growth inhibition system immunity protein, partial [Morganella morganii]